jgi:isopenicillin N synthase-like dioxygenase
VVPVIDVTPLVTRESNEADGDLDATARAIDAACRTNGFFTIVGHGVDPALVRRLEHAAAAFFHRPDQDKAEFAMARAGKAWRGWFPVDGELTSGIPDRKEGIYFGVESPADDPRPLHGPNLFPPGLREPVLTYLDRLRDLGQLLLGAMAVGLGLDSRWFQDNLTSEPVILFRIFHYPPEPPAEAGERWGVAEHTDYGLLTILHQDQTGGLEVRGTDGWQAVPPVEGGLVCNLGDMLERMTGGRYRSTPHRVRNTSTQSRYSFPFFLDPSWDAVVRPLPLGEPAGPAPDRWDGTSVFDFDGTYGDYLTAKVAKVFPELFRAVADG